MSKFALIFGAAFAFLGVAAGAFGAHGLQPYFAQHPALAEIYRTATQYQIYHALGLLLVGLLAEKLPGTLTAVAGYAFFGGILLFSGSLYALVFTQIRIFGAITPLGGVAFLVGWASLFIAAAKMK
ncbi:MAG TPA: DUF423 domain-containing protein [Anaerolineae bacterium]|nr:DUF423 domain-containing protein [Anaerolineae bacterium]